MNGSSRSSGRRTVQGARDSFDADSLVETCNRFTFDYPWIAGTEGDLFTGTVPETEWPEADPNAQPPDPNDADMSSGDQAAYVRPYAWTGGRTKSSYQLELETLVSASDLCRSAQLERLEHCSIADLCQQPRSVAEVGARLGVPLGVAKVLLGDMADLGLINVHRTVQETDHSAHLMLMERVLSGLRRL